MTPIIFEKVLKQTSQGTLLKNITLTIPAGSQIGLKVTHQESRCFFNLLTGKTRPTSGQLVRNDTTIMANLTTDAGYPQLTVSQYAHLFLKLSAHPVDLAAAQEALALHEVWQLPLKRLSQDQQQRVVLLRLVVLHPDLAFLENPLNELSDDGIQLYLQGLTYLRQSGVTVICTAPYLEELLLVSDTIYRYSPTGLESVDLKPDTPDTTGPAIQPTQVFKIACKQDDKTIFFSPDEIDFIESINSISTVHVGNDTFSSTLTLTELEAKLQRFGFFRCHRSYLVNLQRIAELISYSRNSYTLILKGHPAPKLPLSRTRLEELRTLISF